MTESRVTHNEHGWVVVDFRVLKQKQQKGGMEDDEKRKLVDLTRYLVCICMLHLCELVS